MDFSGNETANRNRGAFSRIIQLFDSAAKPSSLSNRSIALLSHFPFRKGHEWVKNRWTFGNSSFSVLYNVNTQPEVSQKADDYTWPKTHTLQPVVQFYSDRFSRKRHHKRNGVHDLTKPDRFQEISGHATRFNWRLQFYSKECTISEIHSNMFRHIRAIFRWSCTNAVITQTVPQSGLYTCYGFIETFTYNLVQDSLKMAHICRNMLTELTM